jgi:peptide/nickel transport system substrate-binding protein
VVLRLSAPYAPLEADLSGPGGMIASPAQLAKLGEQFGTQPVCVGPYEFASRRAGDSITLRRSSDYYEPETVHLDEIYFKVMPDEDARGTSLRSGAIDVAPEPPHAAELKDDPDFSVTSKVTAGWSGLYFNVGNADGIGKPPRQRDHPLSSSVEARQALIRALDREALLSLHGGEDGARMSCSLISTASPYYDDPPCEAKGDPEAAKQLLEDAGIQTPIEAKFLVASKPDEVRLAQAIQAMAAKAGFDLKIETCDVASCIKQMLAGDFDLTQGGFDGFPDPDVSISPFVTTGGGFNFIGFGDPEIDRLLAEARAETADDVRRKELYAEALELLREQAPLVVFSNPAIVVASSKDVAGYVVTPSEMVDYTSAGFLKG